MEGAVRPTHGAPVGGERGSGRREPRALEKVLLNAPGKPHSLGFT